MSNLPSNLFQPLVIILACLIILVSKMPGGVSKSMLKQSRLNFDKIEKCE